MIKIVHLSQEASLELMMIPHQDTMIPDGSIKETELTSAGSPRGHVTVPNLR
jgi:hypothetical protein